MNSLSVKEICEKIWELEDDYDLLDKEIDGVKVWQYLRMDIYYEIAQKTDVFTKPHTSKNSFGDLIKAIPSYLYGAIFKNPLLGDYEKDILVFDHKRKKIINDEYIDIYTKYLLDDFSSEEYDVIESPYLRKHWTPKQKNRKYLDSMLIFSYLLRKTFKTKFSKSELNLIKDLENEINNFFDIQLNIKKIFYQGITNFKCRYQFYDKLLQKRNPDKIYLVVSYFKGALIAAAKKNNIKTIEIQHGTISPYHMGYNFPNTKNDLSYFPDCFYSFGQYWSDIVSFPIEEENIISYGFPYMNKIKEEYETEEKVEGQIIFISQGSIGKQLSKFAYKVANKLEDYKIIYKLHPGEYDRWKDEYDDLVLADELSNVEIIDDNEKDLYYYFAKSEYQVGVFSTAIYEGLAFGCKTLLIDLPGIEYMKYLINKGIVKKVSKADEFKDKLTSVKSKGFSTNYFFEGI